MSVDIALSNLASQLAGSLLTDPTTLESFSRDFGGIMRRVPRAVARPSSVDDLQTLVCWASRTATPLALRGAGHSQAGHVLTDRGVVVDLRGIDAISGVDSASELVEVGAGASWGAVVERTKPFGLAPRVLTTEHATTVGGTLSVGGYGSTSHRHGAQVNNVAYLDVIDGTGELRRCSPAQNTELFDCARAGLGQFGIIARAGLLLRSIRSRVRTFEFSYDRAGPFLGDLARLMRDGGATHLLAHLTDAPGSRWRPTLRLTAGIEYDPGEEPDDFRFGNLNFQERLPPNDAALFGENHIFYFRHEDWFGAPDTFISPWVDHLFAWDDAQAFLDAVLGGRYTPMLRLGLSTMIPTAAIIHSAPLAVRLGTAHAGPLLGVGIFPRLPNHAAELAGVSIVYDADVKREYHGQRTLYGYCDAANTDWASEFGELWPWVQGMKRRFDPAGVFNPDFLGGVCLQE